VGTLLLGEALAGAVIGLMLASGQLLESYATARARRELMRLLARAPRVAHRWQDSTLTTVAVEAVELGDVLLVKEADVVPVDGVVIAGTAGIDASALTGEARPVECRARLLFMEALKPRTPDEAAWRTSTQAGSKVSDDVRQRGELPVVAFGDLDPECLMETNEEVEVVEGINVQRLAHVLVGAQGAEVCLRRDLPQHLANSLCELGFSHSVVTSCR
jgi:hypothetical protein